MRTQPKGSYSTRVRAFEKQGMSTSDAQGCADAQDVKWSELSRLRIENAKLVEALREMVREHCFADDASELAISLLRELGETP